jgi:hypothetical protein
MAAELATRNDVKIREITCGYAKGVDGINMPNPRQTMPTVMQRRHLADDADVKSVPASLASEPEV